MPAPTSISRVASVPARPIVACRLKCDRNVKLHLPEALYDDLARQARADSRAVSEYIRVVLQQHLYGALGARG